MTDRDFVESTVAYLAEHVTWMWHKYSEWILREVWSEEYGDWYDTSNDASSGAWAKLRNWLRRELNPKHHPLVSADWWDERGESKLAELLRKQNTHVANGHARILLGVGKHVR